MLGVLSTDQHNAETRRQLLEHRKIRMTELYTTYDWMFEGGYRRNCSLCNRAVWDSNTILSQSSIVCSSFLRQEEINGFQKSYKKKRRGRDFRHTDWRTGEPWVVKGHNGFSAKRIRVADETYRFKHSNNSCR